jgi:hypothetical protein
LAIGQFKKLSSLLCLGWASQWAIDDFFAKACRPGVQMSAFFHSVFGPALSAGLL